MDVRTYSAPATWRLALAAALILGASGARAQVAPFQYWSPVGPLGVGANANADGWSASSFYDDGSPRGFAFRSYSVPLSAFNSARFGGAGAFGGLAAEGAQYGYSFKGVNDMPVTLFGGVQSLRSTGDTISALTNPNFAGDRTLATSFQAGVEFKPSSNLSLSVSGSFVQPTGGVAERSIRPSYLPGERPFFDGDGR